MIKLNQIAERIIWVIILASAIAGTVYVANYVRDHDVYRTSAAKCSTEQTVLGQEIDNLKAEIKEKELHIDELKELPL